MADISKITLPSGNTYDIKDAVARQTIAGGVSFLGVTTTAITDGATTNPIVIDGKSVTAAKGGLVVYNKGEFIFDGSKWYEFGDLSGLGDLATKDSASGSYTPAGTVSQPTFTGASSEVSVTVTPETTTVNSITNVGTMPTFSASVSSETLTIGWTDGTVPTKGADTTVATGIKSASGTVTPSGTVSQPTFTGTPATITVS